MCFAEKIRFISCDKFGHETIVIETQTKTKIITEMRKDQRTFYNMLTGKKCTTRVSVRDRDDV